MSQIRVLDKHTAELIAAGEVVERPASVVKELIENAIDAGASQVTISIESGGVKLIEISDDGTGIEAEDIPTAFIRHATSKIQTQDDLDHIQTLGFRGEALASIASVARVELLTRTQEADCATLYRIEGGESLGAEPAARGVGTTIRVRDLFYNTPARMKFLKKDSSEGTFVADIVAHVALSHPAVRFKFVREGKVQYVTPGDGQLRSAVYAVLGREFSRSLLELDNSTGPYRLWGLITPPKGCRASRSMQYFYINGRNVRNRTMMAALEGAYKGTMMQGKFPGCILMLQMPPELVDVNVHPAKVEVRFAREGDIFDVVYHAVKLALAQPGTGERQFAFDAPKEDNRKSDEIQQENSAKQIGFTPLSAVLPAQADPGALPEPSSREDADILSVPMQRPSRPLRPATRATDPDWPEEVFAPIAVDAPPMREFALHSPERPAMPETKLHVAAEENIFRKATAEDQLDIQPELPEQGPVQDHMAAWTAAEPPKQEQPPQKEETEQLGFDVSAAEPPLEYVGELFRTYILAQRGDEVCVIDKHAAHERQLFEKLAADYGSVPGQLLLQPLAVNLGAAEKQALLDNLPLLENAGLEVEDFGGTTVLLRTVPADVEPQNAEELLVELADKLAKGSRDALNERTEWVLHSIACRAAVKAGDRTSPQELMALAEKILSGQVPPFCPHGRPCVLKLTRKELEKQFGRIV
jgi:DNA mismatch repair protein MutL